MSNEVTEIITSPEFLRRSKKKKLRPGAWKWKDIYPRLMDTVGQGPLESGRGGVSLVHKDFQDTLGVSPNLNVVVQVLKPGMDNAPHRHSNMALFLVFQGEGHSVIDGEKIEWERGDLIFAPAWSEHSHRNTSETEDAILITIQDTPTVNNMGIWFLEEPIGDPPRHIFASEVHSDAK